MKKLLSLTIWIVLSLQQFVLAMPGGDHAGNGGDPVAIEFIKNASTAINAVKKSSEFYPELKSLDLKGILQKAHVVVTDEILTVIINQTPQTSAAMNKPAENLILVNRQAWGTIQHPEIRQALALHEVLGLAGLESSGNYPITARYMDKVKSNIVPFQMFSCESHAQSSKTQSNGPSIITNYITQVPNVGFYSNPNLETGMVSATHVINGETFTMWVQYDYYTTSSDIFSPGASMMYMQQREGRFTADAQFFTTNQGLPSAFGIYQRPPITQKDGTSIIFWLTCKEIPRPVYPVP